MPKLPPNPYIAEDVPRKAFEQMSLSLMRLYTVTVHADAELTDSYMLLALQHGAAIAGDRLTGFYAAVWECAHYVNALTGSEVEDVQYELGEPSCDHETCRIANEAEATLIEAAVRGDGDAVKGVCKAVVAESHRNAKKDGERAEPELDLYLLWSGTLRRFFNAFHPEAPEEG